VLTKDLARRIVQLAYESALPIAYIKNSKHESFTYIGVYPGLCYLIIFFALHFKIIFVPLQATNETSRAVNSAPTEH